MRFLDTNVLLYSISDDPSEAQKRNGAIELLDSTDNVLSAQVLQEFHYQATRPTRKNPLEVGLSRELIKHWQRFQIVPIDAELVLQAASISEQAQISYWDAAIVAAAITAGCEEIYTEDLNHGQLIASIRIINPFI